MKAKRRKAIQEKRAAKLAGYRKAGDSKYARKARHNTKGNFSAGSPFRSVVTIIVDLEA